MPKEFSNLFDHFYHSFSKNPSKPALILDTGKEYKLFGESKTNEVAEKYDYEILANLPHDPLLLEQCEKGHPLTDLVPDHKVSQMFIELAENLLKRLKLEQLANTN